jgi:hypothetical protein
VKTKLLLSAGIYAGICVAFTGVTPALAAPQWLEDYCWHHAVRVRPSLTAREREAYIANCIADHTPPLTTKKKPSY